MVTVTNDPETFPALPFGCAAMLLLAFGLAGSRVWAQGTTGASLQAGQHGPRLAIDINGTKITESTVMSLPDTILLTVNPLDSLGNPYPLVGYEVQAWDPGVIQPVGSTVEARRAVTRLVPRKRGQTTIQVRASGMRQWILVEVGATTLTVSPKAGAPAQSGGAAADIATRTAGARLSYAHYEYTFHDQTTFTGQGGFIAEGFIGCDCGYGVVVVGGVGIGVVKADSLTTSVNAGVLEAYFRLDYAFLSIKPIKPIVSAGAGAYRVRTGGNGSGIWNTSLYWMLGFGADVVLSPKVTGELRMTTQQLEELNSGHLNGHVGNLLVIGAGLRFQF